MLKPKSVPRPVFFIFILHYVVIPVVPLSVLNVPWWGIAIYTLLSIFSLTKFINPITFIWALVIELQRPKHDLLSIVFFISFVLYALYFYITVLSPIFAIASERKSSKNSPIDVTRSPTVPTKDNHPIETKMAQRGFTVEQLRALENLELENEAFQLKELEKLRHQSNGTGDDEYILTINNYTTQCDFKFRLYFDALEKFLYKTSPQIHENVIQTFLCEAAAFALFVVDFSYATFKNNRSLRRKITLSLSKALTETIQSKLYDDTVPFSKPEPASEFLMDRYNDYGLLVYNSGTVGQALLISMDSKQYEELNENPMTKAILLFSELIADYIISGDFDKRCLQDYFIQPHQALSIGSTFDRFSTITTMKSIFDITIQFVEKISKYVQSY